MLPHKYRPQDDGDNTPDWEDNAISNSMAWASDTFTPGFCATPEHWTSRVGNYFWTECPCCLFIRGVIIGVSVPIIAIAMVTAAMYVI